MTTSAEQSKNAAANGTAAVELSKDSQNLLSHLEPLERIIKLVGAAWDKSQDVYGKFKENNRVLNWALSAAEDCVSRAVKTAVPIVSKLDRLIQYVDQTLVKGIDKLEVTAPIIKDTLQEIYNQAKSKVIDVVQPHIDRVYKFMAAGQQKASSLKELAWHKANEVLATQYGSLAVTGVDTTTALAERLLEYYFPKCDTDVEEDNVPVSASENPVLHTVQTVGRLSHKISRRVYQNVFRQIKPHHDTITKDTNFSPICEIVPIIMSNILYKALPFWLSPGIHYLYNCIMKPHVDRVYKFMAADQQKASSLKELAWHKANEVLATQFGSLAVTGVDTTTARAECLLEYYFPKCDIDVEEDNVPVSASEDPVLHTVQTVGRLSHKISNRVYQNVSRQITPHIDRVYKFMAADQQKASSLKELAWHKANEVLATQFGSLAVTGVDTTTARAECLLEYYFPKCDTDVEEDNVPVSASEDPVLHTVQTVGRLSHKISRRVYQNVSRQIKRHGLD